MEGGRWDGGIQEDPARPSMNYVGKSSTGLLRSPSTSSKKSRKKSVRFSNAVTVKVVPRISQTIAPKKSFITGTLLDPTTRTFRYLLLFLLCAQTYGPNFSRFSPNILEHQLMATLHINSATTYNLLLALVEIPALLLVFLGGYLMDRYYTVGKWAMGVAVGVVIGQLVMAIGAFTQSIVVLLIGRVIFQTAAGCLYVAQSLSMARWLAGVEMGLAVGVALSAAELTMYFANWMLPIAASDYSVGSSLLIGALMGVGSLSATVLASALDAWGNDQLPKPPRKSIYKAAPPPSSSPSPSPSDYYSSSSSSSSCSPDSPGSTVITTKTMTATMTSRPVTRSKNSNLTPSTPYISLPTDTDNSNNNIETNETNTSDITTNISTELSPDNSAGSIPDIMDERFSAPLESPQLYSSEIIRASPPPLLLSSSPPNLTPHSSTPARIVASATMQIKTTSSSTHATPRTTNSIDVSYHTYGTSSINSDERVIEKSEKERQSVGISATTHGSVEKQINEEDRHLTLLALLAISSLFVLVGGAFSHGLDKIGDLLFYAAATGPVVGWIIDRAGRPSAFFALGACAQLVLIIASIIIFYFYTYTHLASNILGILLGITWAVVVCSAWTGLALLVPGGWGGIAFACVTGVNTAAVTLAPMLNTHAHLLMWIPAAAITLIGVGLAGVLYSKKSILNMNAHDIRRVVGYTLDSDEHQPLLSSL